MKVLLIINDGPYGSEKAYNAFRLAYQLLKDNAQVEVRLFFLADAVACTIAGQETANGYYNIERMLKSVVAKGARLKICGSCAEARGISKLTLVQGAELSNMGELAAWVTDSDKVLTF